MSYKLIYLTSLFIFNISIISAQNNEIGKGIESPKIINNFENVYNSSIAFGDVDNDNDNDQDVLITGNNGVYVLSKLYLNDGLGNFSEDTNATFENVSRGSIAFADIDNDGDSDLLITGSNSSGVRTSKLYLNDGSGNYMEDINNVFAPVDLGSIAFVDTDNDNDQDVLVMGDGNSGLIAKLYINDGNGLFTELQNTLFVGATKGSVAFSDIDNDNDNDLVITGFTGSNGLIAKLYRNNGNNDFTEITDVILNPVMESSVSFADIDNDLDQDLIITGLDGGTAITKLYLNDGTGYFTELTNTGLPQVYRGSIDFADVDNDNDLDLFISGRVRYNSNNLISKLFKNNGAGFFTESNIPFTGSDSGDLEFVDADNNNIKDLMITGRTLQGVPLTTLYYDINNMPMNTIDYSKESIKVYPNPTTGTIYLELDTEVNKMQIYIRNLNGSIVKKYFKMRVLNILH